jgi:hypothetical protein
MEKKKKKRRTNGFVASEEEVVGGGLDGVRAERAVTLEEEALGKDETALGGRQETIDV